MKYFLIVFFAVLFGDAAAQYSSDNKKAIKFYTKAESCFNYRDFDCAEENLLKALNKDEHFYEAYVFLSDVYGATGNFDKGIEYLKKLIALNPSFYPNSFFYLGEIEMRTARYKDALAHFKEFTLFKNASPEILKDAHHRIKSCEFALHAMENPVPFEPVNMGASVNSKLMEYFPCITTDNSMFLFTRRIINGSGFNEDFFVSFRREGEWTEAINMGGPINSTHNEGAPSISPDGQFIFFAACDEFGAGFGPNRNGIGSCDLFVTKKDGKNWIPPVNLGGPVNSYHWESQPSFSSDGKTLYYIRGRKTGEGIKNQDIWTSTITDNGWSTPKRLSDKINTAGREESVFIHPDGQTLYFSSDGHIGMGGLDIFVARKDADGEWGAPENLGYPINTSRDENSLLVTADGTRAYFASDREGGYGDLDIYWFDLPEEARPVAVTYMKGSVFDSQNKNSLKAKFELIDLNTGEVIVESYSNKTSGDFLVCLPVNKEYALNVSKNGYLFYSENFTLNKKGTAADPVLKDIPLKPVKEGEEVVLKNIFFETNKYDLEPKSRSELERLIRFLEANPGVKIEIAGHTDDVGSDASNKLLSKNRAKAVYTYLVEHKIAAERLTFKGYGETKPVASNETEEGRAQNRRTAFTVLAK